MAEAIEMTAEQKKDEAQKKMTARAQAAHAGKMKVILQPGQAQCPRCGMVFVEKSAKVFKHFQEAGCPSCGFPVRSCRKYVAGAQAGEQVKK